MNTNEDPAPSNRWHSFIKGWQDACVCRAKRPELAASTHPDVSDAYEAGFTKGVKDRRKAQDFATLEYRYFPSVLRAQDNGEEGG